MMSGAVPPTNDVSSWSCTEPQSPCTYLTWMFGLALFHASTIDLFAATVGSCHARLWNVSVVAARWEVAAEAAVVVVTAATAIAATAIRRRLLLIIRVPFLR